MRGLPGAGEGAIISEISSFFWRRVWWIWFGLYGKVASGRYLCLKSFAILGGSCLLHPSQVTIFYLWLDISLLRMALRICDQNSKACSLNLLVSGYPLYLLASEGSENSIWLSLLNLLLGCESRRRHGYLWRRVKRIPSACFEILCRVCLRKLEGMGRDYILYWLFCLTLRQGSK